MAKFIEVTDYDDQPILVNVDNIIWVKPYEDEDGSILYVTSQGKNDYPVNIFVKENYSQVTKLILK